MQIVFRLVQQSSLSKVRECLRSYATTSRPSLRRRCLFKAFHLFYFEIEKGYTISRKYLKQFCQKVYNKCDAVELITVPI